VRALLIQLVAGGGTIPRELAGLAHVPKERRPQLRRLGVTIGALDIFVPALLKPGPRRLLKAIGVDRRALSPGMAPVIEGDKSVPGGYRRAGKQAIRVDMAEKLFRAAHDARASAPDKRFALDTALGTSMGLVEASLAQLMRDAGFRPVPHRALPDGAHGPPAPRLWEWRAPRTDQGKDRSKASRQDRRKGGAQRDGKPREGNVFAQLADLVK
jgi:ATP-dependent RNA helicase SUPV3L1/SUV3